MARLLGRIGADGRRFPRTFPRMEYALVGLLFAVALVGSATDADIRIKLALGGLVSDYYGGSAAGVPGVAISLPK